MKKILYIFLLLFESIFVFSAQKQKEAKADEYFELYSFDKAIQAYKSVTDLDTKHLRNLAQSYYNRGEFEDAEKVFEMLIKQDSCTRNDYYYFVLALKANEKYEKANK